mgnify:CR=1 FL=1
MAKKTENTKGEIKAYPCKIMGDVSKPADLVILFFHGYGATADNFAPLSNVIGVPGKNVLWVFPQAPSDPAPQWFPLDVNKMAMAMMSGPDIQAKMIREVPAGIDKSMKRANQLVSEILSKFNVESSKLCIAGFSQGAVMAITTALCAIEKPCAGLVACSPYPCMVDHWKKNASTTHNKTKVFLSHGKSDMLIPFFTSAWVHQVFQEAKSDITYTPHPGSHAVGDGDTFKAISVFLSKLMG